MKLYTINTGYFKLDGGAMFGVVPKSIWNKINPADENNMCSWALRSMLIEDGDRLILIDNGMGDKQSEKFFSFYYMHGDDSLDKSLSKYGFSRDDITDVFLTHLHFDHAGGIVTNIVNPQLTFPNAVHLIQKAEWEISENPDLLNTAAYNFSQNLKLLKDKGKYQLLDGDTEIVPGFTAKLWKGHSHGMQGVRI
ncbi:MAG TPA: MBL fold metallo-hydrolase, partial [Chitinophagaceae bacterium]|nr:MBL fold metallo-hydrolase [Chitinophagaceae bacterium]